MYRNINLTIILSLIITLLALMSTGYLIINTNRIIHGYEMIVYFPIAYLVTYFLFVFPTLRNYGISIFLAIFITVSFTRYVVLSVLIVETQWFFGRATNNPSVDSFETAILIMIYELFIYSISIFIFHKKLISRDAEKFSIKFPDKTLIYILFIVFTLFLLLLRPQSLSMFSFFTVNDNFIGLGEVSTMTSVIALLLNVSKILIMLLLINYSFKIFGSRAPIFNFIVVCSIILLNIFIFFGSNRSDFIFNAIASIILLVYLYKKIGVFVSGIIAALLPLVIISITSHRETVTITRGGNPLIDLTDNLQVYLAGVYNVALGVEISHLGPIFSIPSLLLDIFRSAIGPNIIIQNFEILLTSTIFNNRIFGEGHVSQIIPMISQGQYYLGAIFAPFLGVVFIFIAVYFTKFIINTKRIELIFIFSLFAGRLGFVMAQNGNILINDLTFILPMFLIVYILNNKAG